MDHLIDHIYIGNAEDAKDVNLLRHYSIGVIVNLTEIPGPFYDGVKHFQLNQPDNYPVAQHTFEDFFEFLSLLDEHRPTLIHCAAGVSRTAVFTTALLVRHYGMSWEEAIGLIKQKRPCCNPSPVLVESLRGYLDL